MATYVAVFVTVAAVIAGVILWQTNELLIRQVFATLSAEAEGLRELALQRGPEAAARTVAERSNDSKTNLYFLTDAQGRRIAGNLNRWPPELREGKGGLFHYAVASDAGTVEHLAIGLPVRSEERRVGTGWW